MKKLTAIIVLALIAGAAAFAVPAWRGYLKYTQPDGSVITIQKHGDEFHHWTTDSSGRLVARDADGFFRPIEASRNEAGRRAAQAVRQQRNAERRAGEHVAVGQKHFLVILVEFSDLSFSSATANEDFSRMLNQEGYSENGATGSARDFYYENSHQYFEPIFDVYGPVKLSQPMAYYGGNVTVDNDEMDKAPEEAVADGCRGLDEQIDFSMFDNDNDGQVDLVFMYYAGYGEADSDVEDSIWPHQWELRWAGINLILDGKRINSYACSNELDGYGSNKGKMGGIGTVCHEFGHAMGLPDFYDTDYTTNGEAGGLYSYSIMCGGSYNNNGRTPPYFNMEERILLGWIDESVYQEFPESGNYALPGVDNNVAWKTATEMDGEYFVYECRNKSGWDKYIPEAGMIVYHVDKSDRSVSTPYGSITAYAQWAQWHTYNSINENGSHPCFYIVPAGSQSNLNYSGSNFAFPGKANATTFTAKSWDGVTSIYSFEDISYDGSQVSVRMNIPSAKLDYNVIANPGNGVYQAGEEFALTLVESESRPVASVQWFFDDEPVDGSSVTLRSGEHTVEAAITLTDGGTKTVSLEITVN
jgi:M6 family metalloprotease-like protein